MKPIHISAEEANRLIRQNFNAQHYDVRVAEDGKRLSFLVTGIVPKYHRQALKQIATIDQRYLTKAAFNELACRKKLALGRYVIWLDDSVNENQRSPRLPSSSLKKLNRKLRVGI